VNDTEIVATLIDEIAEYFGAFDHFPLYQLGWHLNGLRPTASPEEKRALALRAFETYTAGREVMVVWTRWPIELAEASPLEVGTELDFDLDPDEDISVPLQVLVDRPSGDRR
jgi:hypothetical protein